jgi:hypothetical protein
LFIHHGAHCFRKRFDGKFLATANIDKISGAVAEILCVLFFHEIHYCISKVITVEESASKDTDLLSLRRFPARDRECEIYFVWPNQIFKVIVHTMSLKHKPMCVNRENERRHLPM